MKLEMESAIYFCVPAIFKINGMEASTYDFGHTEDISSETAEPYGCGDRQFISCEPTQEVLDKYRISRDEYEIVIEKLKEELSFGCCGWCI